MGLQGMKLWLLLPLVETQTKAAQAAQWQQAPSPPSQLLKGSCATCPDFFFKLTDRQEKSTFLLTH